MLALTGFGKIKFTRYKDFAPAALAELNLHDLPHPGLLPTEKENR
jgi:hypothetical protein